MSTVQTKSEEAISEITTRPQWVCWRFGEKRKSGKREKQPLNPRTGVRCDATDPEMWGSYERAVAHTKEHDHDGIGFVLTADDPIAGIDVDNAIDPDTGEVHPLAVEIVERLDTYFEISPSGRGLRGFVIASKPGADCRRDDWQSSGVGVELYDRKKFLTVTSDHHAGFGIESRQQELEALYWQLFPAEEDHASSATKSGTGFTGSDEQLIEKMRSGGEWQIFRKLFDRGEWQADFTSQSSADFKLCKILAFWLGPDAVRVEEFFRQSALMRGKWDESRGNSTYGEITASNAIKHTTKFYEPSYSKPTSKKSTFEKKLIVCLTWWVSYSWPGRGGASDRDVYRALLRVAQDHGKDVRSGIVVGISYRDLVAGAGLGSNSTLKNALRRLGEDEHGGVVRQLRDGTNNKAAEYLIRADANLYHPSNEHGVFEMNTRNGLVSRTPYGVPATSRIRNNSPKLEKTFGKRAAQVLDYVHRSQPSTLVEITGYLKARRSDVKRRNIKPLLDAGLILETEDGYTIPQDVEQRLEDYLEVNGHNTVERRQRAKIEWERTSWREKTESKKPVSPTPVFIPEEEKTSAKESHSAGDEHPLTCDCLDCSLPEPHYAKPYDRTGARA